MEEKHSMHEGARPQIYKNAQALRARMTEAEVKLWAELSNNKLLGFKFRRQHPFNRYVLDFYCHKLKLGIEVDGSIHELEGQKILDAQREQHLFEFGLKVIRFTNEEVVNDIEMVKSKIVEIVEAVIGGSAARPPDP
jgi:very-short-patch-repair endonuclease